MPNHNRKQLVPFHSLGSLKSIALPPKLKCDRCSSNKNHAQFSENQLNRARNTIRNAGHNAPIKIACINCMRSTQPTEYECNMCRKWKGLEAYSKTQRRNPDGPRCYDCVKDVAEQDAIDADVYESEDRSKAFLPAQTLTGLMPNIWDGSSARSEAAGVWKIENESVDNDDGGLQLSQGLQHQLSLSSTNEPSLMEGFDFYHGSQQTGHKWQTAQGSSWHSKSNLAASEAPSAPPTRHGNPASRTPTEAASGTLHSFSSDVAELSIAPSGRSGFAKIKAYDPKKDPNRVVPLVGGVVWDSSDEEENNDNVSDDDDNEELDI